MARYTNQTNVTNRMRKRTIVLVVCAVLCFMLVGANMFRIQILNYEENKAEATAIQLREMELSPNRGTIYDANGKILAQSATVWTISVSPLESKKEQHQLIATGLGEILEVDSATILEKLGKNNYYQLIKQKVDKPVADRVQQFCNENDIDGVNIAADYKRYYPYGEFASTILGFCGSDNQGLAGLESYYNEELTGEKGRVIAAKNGWGLDMGKDYEIMNEAQDGYSLKLTVDETIQHYLEKHLALNAQKHQVQEGAVGIVMNVKTGAILAMANYPAYNPNDPYALTDETLAAQIAAITDDEARTQAMSEARQKQWRNKAVNDLYEPGSVFKIITAASALDSAKASLASGYYCRGFKEIEGRIIKCSQTGGHGAESFSQALINSCNPAFIEIGAAMGKDLFYDYFYSFGLGEKTGIDLPGEQKSIYYTDKTHTAVTLASCSFGQSNKLTPIQMITAVATAVNGGNLVTPHLVSQLLDSDGNVVEDLTPDIRRQVISEETSRTIRNILQKNVTDGNGGHAYIAGYRVGGKSGTSQKLDTPQDNDYIASFLGVAPCDDPEIAILIFFDTPTGPDGYYGGPLAGPVVGSLMGEILPYLGIEPVYSANEQSKQNVTVSSITGYDITEAAVKLQRAGLKIKTVGTGNKVVSQFPAYGQKVTVGSIVVAYTEKGESTMVTVPNLLNKSPSAVETTLISRGLNIKEEGAYSGNSNVRVSRQSPNAGDKVPMGTVITVTYRDPNYVE